VADGETVVPLLHERIEFLVTVAKMGTTKSTDSESGKLRIGDDWNAIRIIALSQSNPLKAIAEFVENCIDAHAKTIAITRGREHGEHYLMVKDDGDGVPRDPHVRGDWKCRRNQRLRRLTFDGLACANSKTRQQTNDTA